MSSQSLPPPVRHRTRPGAASSQEVIPPAPPVEAVANDDPLADVQDTIPVGYERPSGTVPQGAVMLRRFKAIDRGYAAEWVLDQVHRMTMTRTPMHVIADHFGVTIRTVTNWKQKIEKRMRDAAQSVDPFQFFAREYEKWNALEVNALALGAGAEDFNSKLKANSVAQSAAANRMALLERVGIFDMIRNQGMLGKQQTQDGAQTAHENLLLALSDFTRRLTDPEDDPLGLGDEAGEEQNAA